MGSAAEYFSVFVESINFYYHFIAQVLVLMYFNKTMWEWTWNCSFSPQKWHNNCCYLYYTITSSRKKKLVLASHTCFRLEVNMRSFIEWCSKDDDGLKVSDSSHSSFKGQGHRYHHNCHNTIGFLSTPLSFDSSALHSFTPCIVELSEKGQKAMMMCWLVSFYI